MNARKTAYALSAAALLATSAPAFADRWDRDDSRHARHVDRDERVPYRRYSREVVRPAVVERRVIIQRPVYVERPVVVERPVYVERPVVVERPGYVERRVAVPQYPPYYDQPVYGEPAYNEPYYGGAPARGPNPLGAIGGAVIGAAIGSQVGHGDGRAATTAIGAVVGGIIGSNF